MSAQRKKHRGKIAGIAAILLSAAGIVAGLCFRQYIFGDNMSPTNKDAPFLYLPSGTDYERACTLLSEAGLKDPVSFRRVAERMNYPNHVKAGRYRLTEGMSNVELVRMLRSGRQAPVKVTFNSIRSMSKLAGAVASSVEADSADIMRLLADSAYTAGFGLAPQTVAALFIPDTYEFYWNTSAEGFMERMSREHARFWNDDRKRKARDAGLTPVQVSTLASIVEEETQTTGEKPTIAGVYLNRLRIGMPLQADPTVKYAAGDFAIKRVLNRHKEIRSPYNTYMHRGLPPGPICIPSIASLDAVLHYAKHDYLYFCAKDDLSGNHLFARTLEQHDRNARAYHRALNRLKIY